MSNLLCSEHPLRLLELRLPSAYLDDCPNHLSRPKQWRKLASRVVCLLSFSLGDNGDLLSMCWFPLNLVWWIGGSYAHPFIIHRSPGHRLNEAELDSSPGGCRRSGEIWTKLETNLLTTRSHTPVTPRDKGTEANWPNATRALAEGSSARLRRLSSGAHLPATTWSMEEREARVDPTPRSTCQDDRGIPDNRPCGEKWLGRTIDWVKRERWPTTCKSSFLLFFP